MTFVYLITNTITGRLYVGLTERTMKKRWSEHIQDSRRPDPDCLLAKAIRRHGPSAFKIDILTTTDTRKEGNSAEIFYIAILGTYPPSLGIGYNLTLGGDGKVKGSKWSEAQRAKMLVILPGLNRGEKNGMYGKGRFGPDNPMFGKTLTADQRDKHSEAMRGRHAGHENPFFGKKHSPEMKQRWSESRRGSGNPSFGKDRSAVIKKAVATRRKNNGDSCKRGHKFTPENTLIQPNGHRRCRICYEAYRVSRLKSPEEIAASNKAAWTPERKQKLSLRNKAAWTPEKRSQHSLKMKGNSFGKGRFKTHCPSGHPYSPDNVIIRPGEHKRRCRICTAKIDHAKYLKRKMKSQMNEAALYV
jgi:group I intron endonuclease